MIICGIKTTHDGALCLIDNGKLIFSYEIEKLNNHYRHQSFILSKENIRSILSEHGYTLEQVDQFVLDGWGDPIMPGDKEEAETSFVHSLRLVKEEPLQTEVAKYGHLIQPGADLLKSWGFNLNQYDFVYSSYMHVSGHIFGAYCTSPFARAKEDSFVLVWDGGMPPQVFYYDYEEHKVLSLGSLSFFSGDIYIRFPAVFKPFCYKQFHVSIAGKFMAYVAMGKKNEEILEALRSIYKQLTKNLDSTTMTLDAIARVTNKFVVESKKYQEQSGHKDEDILSTFHFFIEELLVEGLEELVSNYPSATKNLCFAGGSALNIKWNSTIRKSQLFKAVWVPPFPNDSGSAIGTACCAMVKHSLRRALDWNVYSGPKVVAREVQSKTYDHHACSLQELARLLHETEEPVVFINDRAALGPRALGNRSILCVATSPKGKDLLNEIKLREPYRPVAPICLEEYAPSIFSPGTPDPYMLFDHKVQKEWKDKIPTVVHLDGTSRLQTVNKTEHPLIYTLLYAYHAISGVPLLCNTSANFKGRGFFPDVQSVVDWGKVNFVWNAGNLYYKKSKQGVVSKYIKDFSVTETVA